MGWTPPPQPTPFNVPPESVLFLDCESVPKVENFVDLDDFGKTLFIKKFFSKIVIPEGAKMSNVDQLWTEHAALYCEFNKLACVSMGVFDPHKETGERTLRVKSFFGYNEAIILDELKPKLGGAKFLCAHNGKRFDFPLLGRKFIQHGKTIPSILNVAGIKPWESNLFDTFDIWAFNDLKAYTSLDTLAYIFGLPSSKTEMDGSKVAEVYYGPSRLKENEMPWEDKTLIPVATYCQGDVVNNAQCYLRLINQPLVKPENILFV